MNSSFQLAFCYYVGFGIRSDHKLAQYWVNRCERDFEHLEEEKDEVVDFCLYFNKKVTDLGLDGFTMIMDHVSEYRRGDYDLTHVMNAYRGEIEDLERAFENDLLVTMTIRATLANILTEVGDLKEAEVLYNEVVKFCLDSDEHGARHSLTLRSQVNLGHIIQEQGRFTEARQIFREVFAMRTETLGPENPETLESATFLGSLLFWIEDFPEAREIYESVLEIRKKVLGSDHIQTLQTITNLACVYREQGLHDQAQDLDEQVLAIKKRILGDDAHETINSMANLALSFASQGRYEKAEQLEVKVLDKRKMFLGELNPVTLVAKTNLATTYFHQGRLDEAEELELKVFQGRRQVLGESHWLTLSSMNNLLRTYIAQNRIESCEQNLAFLLQASINVREYHPRLRSSTLENAQRVCSLCRESGRLESANEFEEKLKMLM